MTKELTLKEVSPRVYDVFFGDSGWSDFIRVRKEFDRKTKRVYLNVLTTDHGATSVSREIWTNIKRSI